MSQEKLWTKDFIFGTLVNLLLMINYYSLMVVVTSYAMKTYEAPASTAGLAASMFIIGALVSRLASGGLMGAVGRKRLLAIAFMKVPEAPSAATRAPQTRASSAASDANAAHGASVASATTAPAPQRRFSIASVLEFSVLPIGAVCAILFFPRYGGARRGRTRRISARRPKERRAA